MPDESYVIRKATAADTTVLSGATLPGVQFYTALGYVADEPLLDDLGHGRTILFVPMHKVTSP
jgi:hypothetical protein